MRNRSGYQASLLQDCRKASEIFITHCHLISREKSEFLHIFFNSPWFVMQDRLKIKTHCFCTVGKMIHFRQCAFD